MLTSISFASLRSDQLFTWSDEYTERIRCRAAKTPRHSCASTSPAQIDSARLAHRTIQAMWQAGVQMRRWAGTRPQVLSVGKLSGPAAANGLCAAGCLWRNGRVSGQLSPKPRDSGDNLRDQPRIIAPSRGALKRCYERAAGCRPRPYRCGIGRRASRQYAGRLARRQRGEFVFCGGGQ
jgi:hypothetical protein